MLCCAVLFVVCCASNNRLFSLDNLYLFPCFFQKKSGGEVFVGTAVETVRDVLLMAMLVVGKDFNLPWGVVL